MANLRNANEVGQWGSSGYQGMLDSHAAFEISDDHLKRRYNEVQADQQAERDAWDRMHNRHSYGGMAGDELSTWRESLGSSPDRYYPSREEMQDVLAQEQRTALPIPSSPAYQPSAYGMNLPNNNMPMPFNPTGIQGNGMGMQPARRSMTPTLDLLRAGQIPMQVNGGRYRV